LHELSEGGTLTSFLWKEDSSMERRSRTSVHPTLILLLGLLMTAPLVAGAMPDGRTTPSFSVSVPFETFSLPVGGSSHQVIPAETQPLAQAGALEPQSSEARYGQTASRLTPGFVRQLGSAGLLVSASGDAVLSRAAGLGSPRQLVLAQAAADRFGIMRNPFFDPSRAAVIRGGDAVVSLATGVIMGHEIGSAMFGSTEVIGADLLEELRINAGWSLSSARQAEAAAYERIFDYVPAFLQSDESYETYIEAARANYAAAA
jgi:hypothetical protein